MDQQDKNNSESSHKPHLADLYEKMSQTLRENLEKAGHLTEEGFDKALKESKEWAEKMKDHYSDDINRVSEFIKRDWEEAVRYTREQTRKNLDMDRIQTGLLGVLSRLALKAGAQLEEWASRLNERLTYQTGEIAGMGSLECTDCGHIQNFEKPMTIPPCPNCQATTFRRGF